MCMQNLLLVALNTITMKKFLFGLALLACTISSFHFKGSSHDDNAQGQLIVAIAYKKKNCNGSSFSEVAGYAYERTTAARSYSSVVSGLKSDLAFMHSVSQNDIMIHSSSSSSGVIIQYSKEMAGWGCSTGQYAVGFGDNEEAAEAHAVRQKNNQAVSATYRIIKYL